MFDAIQIAYWLGLSTWFGGVLFVAVAAPIIFRTIEEADPTLPKVLSVNLEGQHGTLLAGTIVANLLAMISRVQLFCAAAVLLGMIGQWIVIAPRGAALVQPILRAVLFIAALIMVIYDWRIVSPQVNQFRQEYIDHADEPDLANPAKDQFDKYHAESVMVLRNTLFLLLGLILFSGNIHPAGMTITF